MNIPNFIKIIKMSNIMVDFKRFLQLLSPENQLYEMNSMTNQLNKSNCKGENCIKKFRILNELRMLKKQIIFKHKKHLQKYLQKYYPKLL